MRRFAHLWTWSILLGGASACGARTELDHTGYDEGTLDLGTGTVNPLATTQPTVSLPPTVALPPTAPPITVTPTALPVDRPSVPTTIGTAPVTTSVAPDDIIEPPRPCTDQDAQRDIWRLVIPPEGSPNPSPSSCGDGYVGAGETCDDANFTDGDGCDSSCNSEAYFDCPRPGGGVPCVRVDVCGDGVLGETEYCDDGNTTGADGCASSCQVEANFSCPYPGKPCVPRAQCGDGVLTPPEQCEYAGTAGCTVDCRAMPGWTCPTGGPCFTRCGDGIVAGTEQCDDGNVTGGDACDQWCGLEWTQCLASGNCSHFGIGLCGNGVLEHGEACDEAGATATCSALCQLEPQCDADHNCADLCGDGVVTSEECDDGNQRPDDGCSATCTVEAGYSCALYERVLPTNEEPLPPEFDGGNAGGGAALPAQLLISVCNAWCGDGVQQRGEKCDGASPSGANPICNLDCTFGGPFCGDGVIDGDEACDDGVNDGVSGLGCEPGCSRIEHCGDGIVQPTRGETCDLGKEINLGGYDTCTSGCQLAARCGDGIVQLCGYEQCDDGNRTNGDGCSVTCKSEPDFRVR